MKMTKLNAWLLPTIAATVLALGCQKGSDRPTTYSVTGTVTQAGAPLEGASVVFVATGDGQAASGTTDASGKYSLSTFGGDDGAVAGQYGVKIIKMEGGAAPVGGGGEDSQESDAYEAAMQGAPPEADGTEEPKNLLPEKYADVSTSGFSETVAESDNVFDFELE